MGEETAFKNGRISDFQGLLTLTLTLNLVLLHTVMHHTRRPLPTHQISLKSKKLFVDEWTDGRTDIFLPMLLGRLGEVDLKIICGLLKGIISIDLQ